MDNQQNFTPLQSSISQPAYQPQPKSSFSNLPKILIPIIIVGLTGTGAFFYFKTKKTPVATIQTNTIPTPSISQPATNTNTQKSKTTSVSVKYKDKPVNNETLTSYNKDELKNLGVMDLPQGFQVQEEYKGIKFIKTPKKSFNEIQLKLLHQFIENTPKKLLTPGPSAIITFADGEVDIGFMGPMAVAFASGNYVFFSDKSFNQTGFMVDNDLDNVFYTFLHELTHVAQFNDTIGNLTEEELTEKFKTGHGWRLIAYNDPLFKDYAQKTDWEVVGRDEKVYAYELKDKAATKTTDYGKTEILEDMAETVGGIIMTKDSEFSQQRKDWALNFLNENYDSFKKNKFPYSQLFSPVKLLTFDDYDVNKEKEFQSKYQMSDKQTFAADKKTAQDEIKNYLNQELNNRGWIGSFSQNGIKYIGNFSGDKRDIYIEISKDNQGILIIVINGYKF